MNKFIITFSLLIILVGIVFNLVVFLFSKNQKLATHCKKRFKVLLIVYIIAVITLQKVIDVISMYVERVGARNISHIMLIVSVGICAYCIVSVLIDIISSKKKKTIVLMP